MRCTSLFTFPFLSSSRSTPLEFCHEVHHCFISVRNIDFVLTLNSSCLSSLRANTRAITYNPRITHTVDNTTKFPVSARLPNAANTLSKSMGFGATKKSPPKAERWVQRHCNCLEVVFGPTCKNLYTIIYRQTSLSGTFREKLLVRKSALTNWQWMQH